MNAYARVRLDDLLYKLEAFAPPPARPFASHVGWLPEECERLRRMSQPRLSHAAAARALGRTVLSIVSKRQRMGLLRRGWRGR